MAESTPQSTTNLIADLIMSAPGWVRVGIAEPSRRVRLESISNLADHVAQSLSLHRDADRDQLSLPFSK
ncbi:DUF6771 family protein [Novosphingobium soli]|uniref:DUF6771 family protein n=1 Tax=Novosphingobium soli TaxID=574956 RepID=A0ABV6CQA8_9SPHN